MPIPTEKPKRPKKDLNKVADQAAKIAQKGAGVSAQEMKEKAQARKEGSVEKKRIPLGNAKKWLDRIRRSEKVRRVFQEDADRYMRMYQGDYSLKPSKRRNVDSTSVNLVYAYVETAKPAIFSGFPYIRVRPKPKVGESTEDMDNRAKNMELVINFWFKELAVDEELSDVLLDSFFGLAAAELGWETQIEEKEDEQELPEGGEESLPKITKIKDRPFINRLDRKQLFLDPDIKIRRRGRWLGVNEVIPWNTFLSSSLYTDAAKKALKAQEYPRDEEEKNWLGRDEDRSDNEWIELTTIWDREEMKKYVVAKGYDGFVNTDDPAGEEWPYEINHNGDPYSICILDAKRDHMTPYSWSEIKAAEPQIQEMNRLRAAAQIHVKRTLPKYVYSQEAGTSAQISKLMNARSDEAVKLDNPNAFKPLELAEIPPDIKFFMELCRDDYANTSGMQEFQQESLAKTATEANIVQGNSDVRKSMRSKQWEQFVVQIGAKLAQLCQQNMDEAIAVQIAGANGVEWLHVDKDQIQGEFWYDIEPGIMEYKNEDLRKQQLLKYMELAMNNPLTNQRELLTMVAKELDLESERVVLAANQIPPPPPPPPLLKFRELDPLAINDAGLMNFVVLNYLQQNHVNVPPQIIQGLLGPGAAAMGLGGAPPPGGPPQGPPGAPPQLPAPPGSSGKDIANGGMSPNGNQALPAVSGNMHPGGNRR